MVLCPKYVSAQTLVLLHSDGTTTDVELFTQPRIEFLGEKVVITSPVLNMEYAKNDLVRFTYKGNGTAINSQKFDIDMRRDDDRLVFHDVKNLNQVAVYKVNGIRVPVRFIRSGNDAVLPLAQIPQGVYLLSVNGRATKFTKQ